METDEDYILCMRLGPVLQVSMPDSPHCVRCDALVCVGPVNKERFDAGIPVVCSQCSGHHRAAWPEWRFRLGGNVQGWGSAHYLNDVQFATLTEGYEKTDASNSWASSNG